MNNNDNDQVFIDWLERETKISKENITNTFKILESTTDIKEEYISELFEKMERDEQTAHMFEYLHQNKFSQVTEFVLRYAMAQEDFTIENVGRLGDMWKEFYSHGEGETLIESFNLAVTLSKLEPDRYYTVLTEKEINDLTLALEDSDDRYPNKAYLYAKRLFMHSFDELTLVIENPVPGWLNIRTISYVDNMIDIVVRPFNGNLQILKDNSHGFKIFTFFAQNPKYIKDIDPKDLLTCDKVGEFDLILEDVYGEHNERVYANDFTRARVISALQDKMVSFNIIEEIDRLLLFLEDYDDSAYLIELALNHLHGDSMNALMKMTNNIELLEASIFASQTLTYFWQVNNFYNIAEALDGLALMDSYIKAYTESTVANITNSFTSTICSIITKYKNSPYKMEMIVRNVFEGEINNIFLFAEIDDKYLTTWPMVTKCWEICSQMAKDDISHYWVTQRYDIGEIVNYILQHEEELGDALVGHYSDLFSNAKDSSEVIRKINNFILNDKGETYLSKLDLDIVIAKAQLLSDEDKQVLIKSIF